MAELAERVGAMTMTIPNEAELVFAANELSHDILIRQKAAGFIGAVATGSWHEESAVDEALATKPLESLYDALQAAADGDETARKMVETNVSTDVIERTIKAGHVMSVDLFVSESGAIQQHGQSMDSIQANSLRFAAGSPQMRRRVEAETRNAFRIKEYYDQGMLEDYSFVVFSRAADDMAERDMQKVGFFTDTMSCAIQVTSAVGNRLVMESAFVAGKKTAESDRHDAETMQVLLERLDVSLDDVSATGLLDTPLLIHKSLLPNGVSSLVEMYDDAAGGTFFGQEKLRQDYQLYRQKCREREAGFENKIQEIVSELILEAPAISSRVMATERLSKLSGKHMIELTVLDTSINPMVFGEQAAARIEMARWHMEHGNFQQARAETQEAVKRDQSRSCPTAMAEREKNNSEGETDSTSGDDDDCEFVSKKCPECGAKDVKTVVKKISLHAKEISGDCGCSKTVIAES